MMPYSLLFTSGLICLANTATGKQLDCTADVITIPENSYFGTKITATSVKEVKGFEDWGPFDLSNLQWERNPIDFCNVTLTYTHPGLGDSVDVYVWLPLAEWNGNFFGQGGGGYAAGTEGALAPAVALGYAGANTDTGHTFMGDVMAAGTQAESWGLASPGNVNWVNLQNFASIALDDMANLAKVVIEKFYGKAPKYSYWNGCSTGGRQGLMQAQRYPKNYDGILAAAPAINWDNFLVAEQWGQQMMRNEKYFPPTCEFEAIRKAAIDACDELDGVKDGMIAAHGLCKFDAQSVVGQKFDCNGDSRKISKSAAKIINAAWEGPKRNGKSEWFGITHETQVSGAGMLGGLLQTVCDDKNKNCKGTSFPISEQWVRIFLAKDPEYDLNSMTEDDFWKFLHQSRQQFNSIMGTDDPDLSDFRRAGGKMITWHGVADELIYVNGSANYYERVLDLDPKAKDFYRYFEAPGVGHCFGGVGAFPGQAFNSLTNWVEKGKVPDQLDAATIPADKGEAVKYRPLCPYPQVAAYKGGSPDEASSFECAAAFGTKKATFPEHGEL